MHITPVTSGSGRNIFTLHTSGITPCPSFQQVFASSSAMKAKNSLFSRLVMPKRSLARVGAACLIAASAILPSGQMVGAAPAAQASQATPYLVGAGAADITGEPGEVGFMGYGETSQKGSGVHTRQYARAFIAVDRASGQRNLIVVLDALTGWQSLRDELVKRIRAEYGSEYSESNIMITATHTHATPGGITHQSLYNITTLGFHQDTFNAQVEGTMKAVRQATKDLAPGNLTVSTSKLTGVGVNRSREAYNRDSQELRSKLPNGTDPTNMTLRLERNGKTRAVLNWYALHPTSLTSKNTLISSDNKGYAEYLLENQDHGIDRNVPGSGDGFVAAFANANAGDVSPNTWLKPGQGPTKDDHQNLKIQGQKQADAVRAQLKSAGNPVGTGLDSRISYFNFSGMNVDAKYTGTGRNERTCQGFLGTAFGAGSTEDGGGGWDVYKEGSGRPSILGFLAFTPSSAQISCQKPKGILFSAKNGTIIQEKFPVQIMRFGDYYLLGMPGEFTGAVGVQYRQDAAKLFGVPESHIILQGYTNAYDHYVTTPEEYDSQQYEGGATLFGRYTSSAFRQTINEVGTSLKNGTSLSIGDRPQDRRPVSSAQGKVVYDSPMFGTRYGQVTQQPQDAIAGRQEVSARFVGAHPNNNIHHDGSYFVIERREGNTWKYYTGDNNPDTFYEWKRMGIAASQVTVRWKVPSNTPKGQYRIRYFGTAKKITGAKTNFEGQTRQFQVV